MEQEDTIKNPNKSREYVIAQIKKFRINSDVFGNKLCRYDGINEIVCEIVNFKIRWKQEFAVIP